jgi:hypothetical protein
MYSDAILAQASSSSIPPAPMPDLFAQNNTGRCDKGQPLSSAAAALLLFDTLRNLP